MIGIAIAAVGGAILTGLLLMHRQNLLKHLPWRQQWLLGIAIMLLAGIVLHPLSNTWLQLGLSTAYGALLLAGLAMWLKPWRAVGV